MSKIEFEIVRLIEKLHDKNIYPTIHGTELILFGDQKKELIEFISNFSVLKHAKDIRQVLLWKFNLVNKKTGKPLSSIDNNSVELLYNAIFNQKELLDCLHGDNDNMNRKNHSSINIDCKQNKDLISRINIVLFRRGTNGQQLTNILKTLPNINISIILSGTDDSKSWRYGANVFGAPGVPSAGKALVALANDREVKEFLSSRIRTSDDGAGAGIPQFINLVMRLKEPTNTTIHLNDSMFEVFTLAMKMSVNKRMLIVEYLKGFLKAYEKHVVEPEGLFPLSDMPLRSLVIIGAYFQYQMNGKPKTWQEVINEISEKLVDISAGCRILFLTDQKLRLVAMDIDGYIYFSEVAIKNYRKNKDIYGIWLIDAIINQAYIDGFTNKLEERQINFSGIKVTNHLTVDNIDEIEKTVIKVEETEIEKVAKLISEHSLPIDSTNNSYLLKEAEAAFKNADLILYSDEYLETGVGGALIVPGVSDAIAASKESIKICLTQGNAETTKRHIDGLYRYMSGKIKFKESHHNYEEIEKYVNYIIQSVGQEDGGHYQPVFMQEDDNRVYAQYFSSDINPSHGSYPAKALSEIMISMVNLKRAGFVADQEMGLLYRKKSREGKIFTPLGLFHDKKIWKFVRKVQFQYSYIVKSGGFVFDVDMTLLPKKAEELTDYPSLAYYIMRLLRDQIKVGIISGNSEEEQIPRIVNAIRREMRDYIDGLKNLIFYVDGGATKITFDEKGEPQKDLEETFNQNCAMDYKELKRAVDSALQDINKGKPNQLKGKSFGLEDEEKEKFIEEANEKYPNINIKAPWESKKSWKPEWITPNEIKKYKKGKRKIEVTIPWVEKRGMRDAGGKIASVAIKPTPQLEGNDVRGIIQIAIREALGDKKEEYSIRSGGTSTTDITRKNADKRSAVKDFISTNKLKESCTYYFGDEFYERKGNQQIGNDEVVARDPKLQEVHTIAVNMDNTEGAVEKTHWIGRSPQAVLEFLEQIIPD